MVFSVSISPADAKHFCLEVGSEVSVTLRARLARVAVKEAQGTEGTIRVAEVAFEFCDCDLTAALEARLNS